MRENHKGMVGKNQSVETRAKMGRKVILGKSSKYKGVHFDKSRNKWSAAITIMYKVIYLGRFYEEEDAAMAYDRKAFEVYGNLADLNFPEEFK